MLTAFPIFAALGLLAPAESPPPTDEYLYLLSRCDVDGFAPRGAGGEGDFDGVGGTFPDDMLTDDKTFDVLSGRFGRVVFLRPRTESGSKNMLALRGQTISVRTTKRFNLLLWLGASHAPVDRQATRRTHGWVEFTFEDGSKGRGPFGLSDWSGAPEYGEEPGLETTFSRPRPAAAQRRALPGPPGSRNSATQRPLTQGAPIRLWLQRTPIPADKIVTAIELPNLPDVKVAAMTLAWRPGVVAPRVESFPAPQPAPVALFFEPGFPGSSHALGATPDRVREALEKLGIASAVLRLEHLGDPEVFDPQRFPVAVFAYGDAFPADAADSLRRYRKRGGAMVHSGAPFTRPVERTPYGDWHMAAQTAEFAGYSGEKALGITPASSVLRTRVWPTETLKSWGFGALPWDRLELRDASGAPANYRGIDTRVKTDGVEVSPLVNVGSWATAVAATVRQTSGEFAGALDVWTVTSPVWIDGARVATGIHVELLARSAAWCLKEKGKLTEERWHQISAPLGLEILGADPVAVAPAAPPGEQSLELPPPPEPSVERTVYWIDLAGTKAEERLLFASAQGLLHREGSRNVYLAASSGAKGWLDLLEREKLVDKVEKKLPGDLMDMLPHRRAVIVDPDLFGSLNLATMIASAEGLLVAYPGLVERFGLEPASDLRGTFDSDAEMLEWALENLRPRLNNSALACVPPLADTWRLRDLLIRDKLFTFWIPSVEQASATVSTHASQELVERLLLEEPLLTPVLGVRGSANQSLTELLAARHGKWFVALDGASNLTFSQRLRPKPEGAAPAAAPAEVAATLDTRKVYLAVTSEPITMTTLLELERLVTSLPAGVSSAKGDLLAGLARALGAAGVRVPDGGRDPAGDGAPAASLPLALTMELGLENLLSAHLDLLLEARKLPKPTGLALPPSLVPQGFATAFGAHRDEGLDSAFQAIGSAMAQRDLKFLQLAPSSSFEARDWEKHARHLPGGTGVFVAYEAASATRRDLLNACTLTADIPIFRDLGERVLQLFSEGALKPYRPLFPLFVATTPATLAKLQEQSLLSDDIVLVRPEEAVALAKQCHAQRKLEPVNVLAAGALWRYHDRGQDLGSKWRSPEYDDSRWAEGKAELGYGDANEGRPETTVISAGDEPPKTHVCYYFRRTFELAEKIDAQLVLLELLADDGAVVYLDGKEVYRFNMPEGEVKYATSAATAYGGTAEAEWRRTPIDAGLLRAGKHTIAVEVHQSGETSSDLSFDLGITGWRVVK